MPGIILIVAESGQR